MHNQWFLHIQLYRNIHLTQSPWKLKVLHMWYSNDELSADRNGNNQSQMVSNWREIHIISINHSKCTIQWHIILYNTHNDYHIIMYFDLKNKWIQLASSLLLSTVANKYFLFAFQIWYIYLLHHSMISAQWYLWKVNIHSCNREHTVSTGILHLVYISNCQKVPSFTETIFSFHWIHMTSP